MVRFFFACQEFERLAEEARRSAGAVIDAFADLGLHNLDHGANERARGVILAAVAPGVAHVPDLGFVEVGELVLFGLRAEAKLVDVVDDLAEVVAAGNFVFDLAEDFADFVFDGVRPGGLLLEAVKVGEELLIDEVAKVVAGQGFVVVDLAVLAFGRGPLFPAVGLVENEGVLLAFQRGFVGLVLLQPVEVFQEQEPGGLLGVVKLCGAASLFAEDIVDIFEGLFKHKRESFRLYRLCGKIRGGLGSEIGRRGPRLLFGPHTIPFRADDRCGGGRVSMACLRATAQYGAWLCAVRPV